MNITQFAIFRGANAVPVILKRLSASTLNHDYLAAVSSVVFAEDDSAVWVIEDQGDDIDSLAIEAQVALQRGVSFESTRLHNATHTAASWATECAFWYADDYRDLDCVDDLDGLLTAIHKGVLTDSCEIYAYCYNRAQ